MNDMTHDAFLDLLAGLEPLRSGEAAALEDLLPPEAADHARRCEDCARTAEALLLIAGDEGSLFDEPPAAYWADFQARLQTRLEVLPRPAAPRASAPARPAPVLRVAALLALAVGLGALALRDRTVAPDGALLVAGGEPGANAAVDDELAEALSAWSDEAAWGADSSSRGPAVAAFAEDLDLPGLLQSPPEALHEELSLELDDAQAAELARRLHAEISS